MKCDCTGCDCDNHKECESENCSCCNNDDCFRTNNQVEIGKILIDSDYPFALIKYLNENFDEKANFKTKEASINVNKPNWIKN